MKVASIFNTPRAAMILPQLEEKRHGAEVTGMFFFDDNTYTLAASPPDQVISL